MRQVQLRLNVIQGKTSKSLPAGVARSATDGEATLDIGNADTMQGLTDPSRRVTSRLDAPPMTLHDYRGN
jgi:hypothetical protein